ncbi:MAG: S8 family serine peptidase [Nitrosopumilaceae archaeon]|nr:S8 family serine peptidase [Nitrosopumilaceae archaeon]
MVSELFNENENFELYLDKSVPFVGTDIPKEKGIEGEGIKIAVIDTGVDFNHPDLLGWGPDGKVIGGYNFIQEGDLPMDNNGHGTQVAGVIAANGNLKGIAPKAKILAYKVSEDGNAVSSDLIIKAIEKAINDKADIINISLGVNKTNESIDTAVTKALEKEIFVVTAAGNDGPGYGTIGSPGRNFGSVTVGATYNNLTSSLVATLEVNEKPYTVIPMVGSKKLAEPIEGEIIFGGYGKQEELKGVNATDKILLVERGSNIEGELLYFSIKEENSANAGAKALIVYNNEPGIFLGELTHEFVSQGYEPRIPVVSIEREEGLEIRELINEENFASLHLFFNPDYVAHFSSRGPVSPFYIKPDLVAPGAYINTTQNNAGYNFTSGTSYAAPHVSGAAALIMQENPGIHHHEIKSLLLTTVEPVSDAYGKVFSLNDAGVGRLNIARAFNATLIIQPPHFVVNLSSDSPTSEHYFELKSLKDSLENIMVGFEGPEFIQFSNFIEAKVLKIRLTANGSEFGDYEGKIVIIQDDDIYRVPFLLHYTEGSVSSAQDNGKLKFDIKHPEPWSFAKITAINSKDGSSQTTSASPTKIASLDVYENGEYWIETKIRVGNQSFDAFDIIQVNSVPPGKTKPLEFFDLPQKQVGIIAVIVIAIGLVGLKISRRSKTIEL